jgi:acyl carrier protein
VADAPIGLDELTAMLTTRIQEVMALDEEVDEHARFDEDLHADSLDLVEVIEGVERDLAARGVAVSISDDELLNLQTVADAARCIQENATGSDGPA